VTNQTTAACQAVAKAQSSAGAAAGAGGAKKEPYGSSKPMLPGTKVLVAFMTDDINSGRIVGYVGDSNPNSAKDARKGTDSAESARSQHNDTGPRVEAAPRNIFAAATSND